MLGLLLLYFIGKKFYKLAEDFNQNKWLFSILGVVVYYAGAFVLGLFSGLLVEFTSIEIDNTFLMSIIALPFGLGATYLFYFLMKKKWEKSVIIIKDEIQDIVRNLEENNRVN